MSATRIVDGLYAIPVGPVNTFLLVAPDGCILIDSGLPGSVTKILDVIKEVGKQPSDIRNIVLTHAHPDHIGSFAALKNATGAEAFMHRIDAPIATAGAGFRPMKPAPGLLRGVMFRLFVNLGQSVEGARIEHVVEDGQKLPIAPGDLTVIHVPGHCAGQIALFWPQHGGVLFAADTCSNMMGLGWSLGYEDLSEGKRSLKKLSELDFQVACFGHGKSIVHRAAERLREKWPGGS
jgi:glyoxylase-like metal-dependent hydrolase (beta-lactamase superfamily II)